jgi:tetratricopeptide (TPR) repeat protein
LRAEKKLSGYKSIHSLIVTKEGFIIEVQLKTLVQDVWSELEHTLSYKKGSVHPHIKKSFSLLSKDLENIDELFSHLRDISDKEKGGEVFSNHKIGPKCYFDYEDDLLPKSILEKEHIREHYDKYLSVISEGKKKGYNIDLPWVLIARSELEMIREAIGDSESDSIIRYWIDMEDAFVVFCESQYDDAISKYMKIKEYAPERYCVHYRLGEVYFIKGESEIALNYFDKSEELLEASDKHNNYNHFLIKSRLALTYWSLGDEYIDISIQEALAAKDIYDKNSLNGKFTEKDKFVIINSLCWYCLERYINAKRKDDKKMLDGYFTDVKLRFEDLKTIIEGSDDISLGVLDTLMWCHFYEYKRTKNEIDLRKAKEYALQMKGKASQDISFRIMNMHMNHIQEVMQCAHDIFGEG